jgi:uncharacterized protein (TIGR02001 family)
MRTSFGPVLGLILAVTATPAFADEADAPKAITINGSATVVSDYRFRGLSQTLKKPAIQGSITLTHESGIYVGTWGSSVSEYIAAGADQEIDLIAGFKKTTEGGTTFDVNATYYYYPGAEEIVPGYNSDFVEAIGSVSQTLGPVTAKGMVAYAPKQKALAYTTRPKEDNLYAGLDLSAGLPDTPLTLTGHVGRNFTRSFLSSGLKYTDWSLGASLTHKALTFGVSYVDTNKNIPTTVGTKTRNISKGGVVLSLGASF